MRHAGAVLSHLRRCLMPAACTDFMSTRQPLHILSRCLPPRKTSQTLPWAGVVLHPSAYKQPLKAGSVFSVLSHLQSARTYEAPKSPEPHRLHFDPPCERLRGPRGFAWEFAAPLLVGNGGIRCYTYNPLKNGVFWSVMGGHGCSCGVRAFWFQCGEQRELPKPARHDAPKPKTLNPKP